MRNKYTAPFALNLSQKISDPRFSRSFHTEFNRLMLAHRITELREKRGLSQEDLARLVGTTQASIARLENPNYRNYSVKTLERIATALDVRLVVDLREEPRSRKAA
jgi:ribosome-binding protein aMBF1 (putative translation factor)